MAIASRKAFTLVELMVVLVILGLIIALLLPIAMALRPRRHVPRTERDLVSIHAALVQYAQTNGGFYPGVDSDGRLADVGVEHRFWELMNNNYIDAEYVMSVTETMLKWTTGPVTSANYSYAMLELGGDAVSIDLAGRRAEWNNTFNDEAVVVSDRNTGTDTQANVTSVHVGADEGWLGYVAWNDGRASIQHSHIVRTRYGPTGKSNVDDNLFEAAGDDDAYMIYTGN